MSSGDQRLRQAAHAERMMQKLHDHLISMGAHRFHDEYVMLIEEGQARRLERILNPDSPLLPPASPL